MRKPLDQEAIARLYENRAGWLLPDGSLLPATQIMEHLEALKTTEFAPLVSAYEKEIEEADELISEVLASEGPDEHPAMHRFFGMKEEPREELVRQLYERGLLRIGLKLSKTYDPVTRRTKVSEELSTMEVEGMREAVDQHLRRLGRIAKTIQCELDLFRYVAYVGRKGEEKGRRFLACLPEDPEQIEPFLRKLGILPKPDTEIPPKP